MKKIISIISLFLVLSFFSSFAFADVILTMEGPGNTVDAVRAFNKAVISNDGAVDMNAQTEFSSAGNFNAEGYRATMYAEEKKGKISIRIVISANNKDLIGFLTGAENSVARDIANKIIESMKKQ